jgi:hypothetical protein
VMDPLVHHLDPEVKLTSESTDRTIHPASRA